MWVEETSSGKFKFVERYADYLTGEIKKVSVTMDKNTAQSRKTAQKALDEKINKALAKKVKKDYTLSELVEEYREYQERTVKASTYRRNFYACKTLMSILGENVLLDRLTANYVRKSFLNTEKDSGTLNEHLTRFKALIRWGFDNDYIADISFLSKLKPFDDIPHRQKIQDKFLEAEELKELTAGMNSEPWRLLTLFLALSGLRFGEAAALSKSDVDMKRRLIHVQRTLDVVNDVVTSPKTAASIRDVYIQDELMDVCKKVKSCMLQQRLLCGYGKGKWFFEDKKGGHIQYYTYNKYLNENSMKLLGRKITPHALRHTHASLLFEQGISLDMISRRLGHENSQVTREIYLHITERLREKDNEQIAKIRII